MRITHISDTHNKHNKLDCKLPGGQLLIHSGDISSLGRKSEVERFIKWFGKQDYTHKVFIAGNHDMTFDKESLLRAKLSHFEGRTEYDTECADGKPEWLVELLSKLPDNVYYLENSSINLEGINIWGSPYSPTFGYGWAFNKNRGHDIGQYWDGIPMDTDIVITHGPIYGYCDTTDRTYENVGCNDLFQRLAIVKPQLHFSGHIHEAYGYKSINFGDWSGYAFNGCSCNLRYEAENTPISFDYNFETREINFI